MARSTLLLNRVFVRSMTFDPYRERYSAIVPTSVFFQREEIKKKKRRGADVVDAFGDQEPAPSSPSLPSAFPLVPELKRQDTTIEEEFSYDMDHKERGCFIIFNQKVCACLCVIAAVFSFVGIRSSLHFRRLRRCKSGFHANNVDVA